MIHRHGRDNDEGCKVQKVELSSMHGEGLTPVTRFDVLSRNLHGRGPTVRVLFAYPDMEHQSAAFHRSIPCLEDRMAVRQ